VTVNKADPNVTAWPTASAITYGQTLAASTLTGGSATAAGSFAFTTLATAPGAGTASQNVTFTPTDTADYNSASSSVSVTVNKATLTVTATGLLTYGSAPATAVYAPAYATFVGADTPSVVSGSATFSTDATSTSYVGNGYYARIDDVSGLSADNYTFAAGADGILVVTNRPLTVTNVLANDKPYDGTTDVTLDLSGAGLDGLVNDDPVTLNTGSVTAAFASANAGLEAVTVAGLALDGDLGTNYSLVQPTTTATITKANPNVTAWPTASAITYGQTLADSILSGGAATPAGSFAFTTPATAPSAGTAAQSVIYTPTDTANYNTASSTVSVTVNKADPVVTTWPTAGGITYGQTLADSVLSGGGATPAGTFDWTIPSTVPGAGTPSESVTYTPTDAANYNTASSTVSVTVDKANPDVTAWPTAGAITFGQTLAASALSGGVATPAGSFAFTTPATAPNAGTAPQSVTYTPTDTADYNTASSTVSVTVSKANPVVTTWPSASAIPYGQTLADSTLSGGGATPAGTFAWTTPSTVPGAGTPSESVTYAPTDTANYNAASSSVSVTVNAASSTTVLVSSQNPSTNGVSVTFTATISSGVGTPTGNVVFLTNGAALATVALTGGSASVSTADLPVGTVTVAAQYAAQANWQASSDSLDQAVRPSVVYSLANSILSMEDNLDGSYTLYCQGTAGAKYYVVTSSDPTVAMSSWTVVGITNTADSSGLWNATVSGAAPAFYRGAAVDPAP